MPAPQSPLAASCGLPCTQVTRPSSTVTSIGQRTARMPHMLYTVRRPGALTPCTFGVMVELIAVSFRITAAAACDVRYRWHTPGLHHHSAVGADDLPNAVGLVGTAPDPDYHQPRLRRMVSLPRQQSSRRRPAQQAPTPVPYDTHRRDFTPRATGLILGTPRTHTPIRARFLSAHRTLGLPLLEKLEKDVGLLWLEVQIAELVDREDLDADEAVDPAPQAALRRLRLERQHQPRTAQLLLLLLWYE